MTADGCGLPGYCTVVRGKHPSCLIGAFCTCGQLQEQSRLAVHQEREQSQKMISEALAREIEKMERLLEDKSNLLVSTLNEEQVKSVERTQEAIAEVSVF